MSNHAMRDKTVDPYNFTSIFFYNHPVEDLRATGRIGLEIKRNNLEIYLGNPRLVQVMVGRSCSPRKY